jgi:hypothetical protein
VFIIDDDLVVFLLILFLRVVEIVVVVVVVVVENEDVDDDDDGDDKDDDKDDGHTKSIIPRAVIARAHLLAPFRSLPLRCNDIFLFLLEVSYCTVLVIRCCEEERRRKTAFGLFLFVFV